MDTQRFDQLTRLIATRRSRRVVLSGLLAAVIAGHSRATVADCVPGTFGCPCDTGDVCNTDLGCRGDGICVTSCSTASCPSGLHCDSDQLCYGDEYAICTADEDCSVELGLTCQNCPDGVCVGAACLPDNACDVDADCDGAACLACVNSACASLCADGERCDGAGTCIENIVCTAELVPCAIDSECCTGLVCEEVCILACTGDDGCEAGEICCDGHCVVQACCAGNDLHTCTSGEVCFEGACVPFCLTDDDCAANACCCTESACSPDCCASEPAPPALPETGRGGDGNLVGIASALAAAAAISGAMAKQTQR